MSRAPGEAVERFKPQLRLIGEVVGPDMTSVPNGEYIRYSDYTAERERRERAEEWTHTAREAFRQIDLRVDKGLKGNSEEALREIRSIVWDTTRAALPQPEGEKCKRCGGNGTFDGLPGGPSVCPDCLPEGSDQ